MGHPAYPVIPVPYTYPPPNLQMHETPGPHIHPELQRTPGPMPPLTPPLQIKGQDPQSNDMSNTQVGLHCSLWWDDKLT
jgi:hypothetical protein